MTFAFFLVFSIYSSLLSSYFFLFSLRMCLLVSLLLVLLFSFLNHFYCLCLICLISLFSLFDASDFHVQSTLMFWQIKPQEGKKKGKCLSLFFSISLLFLSCSFIHSFVLSLFLALTLPPILSLSLCLSLCFSLILSAFRYFSVSSYLSFNHPFWVTRNFQSDRESKALPTGGRQMDTCHESLQSPLSKFVFLVIIIIIMISIVLIIAIIILVFVFLSDKCTNRRKLF